MGKGGIHREAKEKLLDSRGRGNGLSALKEGVGEKT